MAQELTPVERVPGLWDMMQGGYCKERTGKSLGNPQPHLWTSVMDLGVEFYPCICGLKFPGVIKK